MQAGGTEADAAVCLMLSYERLCSGEGEGMLRRLAMLRGEDRVGNIAMKRRVLCWQ